LTITTPVNRGPTGPEVLGPTDDDGVGDPRVSLSGELVVQAAQASVTQTATAPIWALRIHCPLSIDSGGFRRIRRDAKGIQMGTEEHSRLRE
jgi:hypothetical protein